METTLTKSKSSAHKKTGLIIGLVVAGVVVVLAVVVAVAVMFGRRSSSSKSDDGRTPTLANTSSSPSRPSTQLALSTSSTLSVPPLSLESSVLSTDPPVHLLRGFLTPKEAAHLVSIAQHRLVPSVVLDEDTGKRRSDAERTSTSVYLTAGEDEVVRGIEARAAAAAGIPVSHLEALQVVRYLPGQFFGEHMDTLPEVTVKAGGGSQRTVTIFAYLTQLPDTEPGGSTRFPKLGLRVRPSACDAVMWNSLTPTGEVDTRLTHAGEAVEGATKYGLNIWFRNKPFR